MKSRFYNVGFITLILSLMCVGCGAHVSGTVRDENYDVVVQRMDIVVGSSGMNEEFSNGEAEALALEAKRQGIHGSAGVVQQESQFEGAIARALANNAQAILMTRVDTVVYGQYGNSLGAHMNVSLLALSEEPKLVWRAKIYNPWMVDKNHDGFAEVVFAELRKQRLIK